MSVASHEFFQMTAFDERGAAELKMDFFCRVAHFFNGINGSANQGFRFRQIRRDERGQRQKFFLQNFSGLLVQAIARRWWK